MTRAIDTVVGVGWIVFWAYWLVMAVTAKAGRSRWTQLAGVRVASLLVVLLLVRVRVFKVDEAAATGNPWLAGIGLAVFVLGLALAVWARVYLGRNWGMPMSEKADPELVTTGPYGRVRLNRPGVSGDSDPWEGLGSGHVGKCVEEVPAGVAGAGGADGR